MIILSLFKTGVTRFIINWLFKLELSNSSFCCGYSKNLNDNSRAIITSQSKMLEKKSRETFTSNIFVANFVSYCKTRLLRSAPVAV